MKEFKITDEQEKKIKKWDKEHNCSYEEKYGSGKYAGAIGGRLTYIFTPNSIGVTTKVRCGCGAELDLTDTDKW